MTKLIAISTPCVALIVALTTTTTFASIVAVLGPNSSAGTAPAIIAAPLNVLDSMATNTGQQGFNEMQNVQLAGPLAVDGGSIAAGTWVSSQMIFLNKEDATGGQLSHLAVEWIFDGLVLGVMSDINGMSEAASTGILGAPGTNYTTFNNRGLEGNDFYSVSGNTVTVDMYVTQPGDWIRVVTAGVPEPTTFLVWGVLGFCAVAGTWRRQ